MKTNGKICRNCNRCNGEYKKSRTDALFNKRRRNSRHNRCDTDETEQATGWDKNLKDHHKEANQE
jgi:hypothetical protein